MPRKDEIVQMLLDWEKCFNEAGAFMPRKVSLKHGDSSRFGFSCPRPSGA